MAVPDVVPLLDLTGPVRALRTAPAPVASWLTARAVVLGAFVLAAVLHAVLPTRKPFQDLLGWDADWYRRIASFGYAALPHESLRFFPLWPLLARYVSAVSGIGVAAALLVLANGFALLYSRLLQQLALHEGWSPAAARRACWVAALAPAGFVLVMGYAEALSGCLLAGVMLTSRRRRWWAAAGLGVLLGLLRPTGVVVGVFVLLEAARGLAGCRGRELVARAGAVAAPAVGLGAFLLWTAGRFGEPLAPFTVQTRATLRGSTFVNPLVGVGRALGELAHGRLAHELPHLLWILLSLALLVRCARRLPVSYTAFATATVLLGATARQFASYERYAASCIPLLLCAASLPLGRRARPVAVVAAAVLAVYTVDAALHLYVP